MQRRDLLRASLLGTGLSVGAISRALAEGAATNPGLAAGTRDEAVLEALSGKQKLIKLSYRPPNYEAPLAALRTPITRNDQFFVRYHLAGLPERAELDKNWALTIDGDAAARPARLGLADLHKLPQHEVTAVCQCSGNRRGLSSPHVAGVQWGVGAMGCAVWRGPRLKDVLALAGVKPEAHEIAMNGADHPLLEATPAFIKSIPIDRAFDPDTIVAVSMNDADLPIWNGYPVRLVVPGWTATYWVKHLTHLEIRSRKLEGFWMAAAYRVPAKMFPGSPFPTQDNDATRPITDMVVNSLATSHQEGDRVRGNGFTLSGLAWDNGSGIDLVEITIDDGQNWGRAMLGTSLGRYAFRPWSLQITGSPGPLRIRIRATAKSGATQPEKALFNPAGYHHNAIQQLTLTAI
jgi:sulfite dehydrogenase